MYLSLYSRIYEGKVLTTLQEKAARYHYMDVLRLIGCVLVVCLHVGCMDAESVAITDSRWPIINIFDSLGMVGISFFFMLSGALFLQKDKELSFKYVWKKIGILMAVYIFTLFFYNLMPFLRGWAPWTIECIKIDLLENVIYGKGIYHLWFLPVLMVLYALSPLLKGAFSSKRNCEYFLILFFIFGALIPFLLCFRFPYVDYLRSFQERFALYFLTGHLGLFVLGHYLHEYVELTTRKKKMVALAGVIGGVLFTILCNHVYSMYAGTISVVANTPLSPHGIIIVTGVYLLVKNGVRKDEKGKSSKWIHYLASLTFGIYLLHPLVVRDLLGILSLEKIVTNYFMLVFSRIIVVLVLSGIFAAVLKKLPVLKKIL